MRLAADCDDPVATFEMLRELFGAQVRAISNLEFPPNVVICSVPARLDRSLLNAACAQFLPIEIVRDGKMQETGGAQEDKATQSWDLSVRLLHKAGLTPWRLADAVGDTCFVGVSLYQETQRASPHAWASLAHVVTDFGQGFFLKGDTFEWTPAKRREVTPQLDKERSAMLMSRVLETYRKNAGNLPGKVVVHKLSAYSEAERSSLEDSLQGIKQRALVSVGSSGMFFLRPGRKPIFRGAAIPFGDKLGVVYTSGYIPFLKCSPGIRLPLPLEIAENWGTLTFQEAARDLLRLTKLDWNTSSFCTEIPVTLSSMTRAREIFAVLGKQDFVLEDRYLAS